MTKVVSFIDYKEVVGQDRRCVSRFEIARPKLRATKCGPLPLVCKLKSVPYCWKSRARYPTRNTAAYGCLN